MKKPHILILGGTTEARGLAERLAKDPRFHTTLSLAGRTLDPKPQPVPVRIGGFGGADGLAAYLAAEGIDLLIDATHPFANQISLNAAEAAQMTGVGAFRLCRPAWERQAGDAWIGVHSIAEAVAALPQEPKRIFLAIGRQEAGQFSARPEHSYLVRSVDPVIPPLDVPDARYILDCGPFDEASELALLKDERIDLLVAKNSGGSATYGKIAAARSLSLPVVMVERRPAPGMAEAGTVGEALERIDHLFSPA
jgi:precorrin-6A/cobalt-precorrin-6A reductase